MKNITLISIILFGALILWPQHPSDAAGNNKLTSESILNYELVKNKVLNYQIEKRVKKLENKIDSIKAYETSNRK